MTSSKDNRAEFTEWSIHAPRFPRNTDHPPESSWWAEVKPEKFYLRARLEFEARIRKSTRKVGDKGVE